MWGDIGLSTDVRFYGVAPHRYFRPFMAWLIACPFHKTGIFGLLFFFVTLYYQPNLHGVSDQNNFDKKVFVVFSKNSLKKNTFVSYTPTIDSNLYYQIIYFFFIMCCLYTTSFLPYGRFFNQIGGNWGFLMAYFYVFFYLSFSWFRRPSIVEFFFKKTIHEVFYLKRIK